MVTAEKWYEYEDNYKRYGLDMRPAERRQPRAKAKRYAASSKDRSRGMMYVIILAAVCVGVVISTAYAASVKCEINALIASNTEIQHDIETLNVQIKTANNISAIETRAIDELGMIYPTSENIVYVMGEEEPATNFAMILKDRAYN